MKVVYHPNTRILGSRVCQEHLLLLGHLFHLVDPGTIAVIVVLVDLRTRSKADTFVSRFEYRILEIIPGSPFAPGAPCGPGIPVGKKQRGMRRSIDTKCFTRRRTDWAWNTLLSFFAWKCSTWWTDITHLTWAAWWTWLTWITSITLHKPRIGFNSFPLIIGCLFTLGPLGPMGPG